MSVRPQYNQVTEITSFGVSMLLLGFISKSLRDMMTEPGHIDISKTVPQTTGVFSANEIFARAKEYFGTTTNPKVAGYILPDGTMLDFSGKEDVPPYKRRVAPILMAPGIREVDHREIAFAWPEDDSPGGFEAMRRVMNWGAIRFSFFHDTVIVNLVKSPTAAQVQRIKLTLDYHPDAALVVEVDDAELIQIDYKDFTYPFRHWRDFIEQTIAARHVLPQVSPLPQKGLCYRDAWRFQSKKGGILVHGIVHNPDGTSIKHAWVELNGHIYEPQTKQIVYKSWFKRTARPIVLHKYAQTEAATRLAQEGAHGPWDDPEFQSVKNRMQHLLEKYGWWAVRTAIAVCPYNDVACVEREAKRLIESRKARR